MRWKGPVIDELDAAVARVVPHEPVALTGQWASSARRTYERARSKPGAGPFVDVLDTIWTGSLVGASPIAALVFLASPTGVHWVKSAPATIGQSVRLSLHAHADHSPTLATLGASVGHAVLPAVPVACQGSLADSCVIGAGPIVTGRVSVLASADRADILVLLIPAGLTKVGRKRIWRLRDEYASALPPRTRAVLTRRRTGSIDIADGAA